MFSVENIFGTDGVRGAVGKFPLTSEHLPIVGSAIAEWAYEKYGSNPRILLAHDTRISCSFVKSALKSGLLKFPVTIHDAGVLPTPTVFNIIQKQKYSFGIVISASHNPYHDNGIKIIDAKTGKITVLDEQKISFLIQKKNITQNYDLLGIEEPHTCAHEEYASSLSNYFPANFLRGKKIVLDCAHGATSVLAPRIFRSYGAHVITINNNPDGKNINKDCGALEPKGLQKKVLTEDADAGFAFDGDGDRLIMVNNKGEIRDGDDILFLLLTNPLYIDTTEVVGTIMTNYGFEMFLKNHNKKLTRVAVGDKYIAEYLEKNNLLLGGEQSGHIIMRDYLNTGDGIFVALRVLETLLLHNNFDAHTFTKYPQLLRNVPVNFKHDLNTSPLLDIIQHTKSYLTNGRLIVRYSGTENLLRIMVENLDMDTAERIINDVSIKLQNALAQKNY